MTTPEYDTISTGDAGDADFFEKHLCGALARMPHGALELQRSDGGSQRFGDPHHAAEPACIRVESREFFTKASLRGEGGLASAYVDGDWNSPDPHAVLEWFIRNAEHAPKPGALIAESGRLGVLRLADSFRRLLGGKADDGPEPLPPEFMARWLDGTQLESTAWFSHPDWTLGEAQQANLDRACRALRLSPGVRVLEVGGGRGAFALHAARAYGAQVVSLTRTAEHAALARARAKAAGLDTRIEVRAEDYREHRGEYDRVVSLESREWSGAGDMSALAKSCDAWLTARGLLFFQYLTCSEARRELAAESLRFERRYIRAVAEAMPHHLPESELATHGGFELAEFLDLTPHAVTTCRRLRERLETAATSEGAPEERRIRQLRYHLAWREAEFALRRMGVAQALFTRPENPLLAVEAT